MAVCLFVCLSSLLWVVSPALALLSNCPFHLVLHVLHNFDYFLVCVSPRLTVQYVYLLYDNVGSKEGANIPLDSQPV